MNKIDKKINKLYSKSEKLHLKLMMSEFNLQKVHATYSKDNKFKKYILRYFNNKSQKLIEKSWKLFELRYALEKEKDNFK